MNSEHKSPPTLEELLRLKRAETPPAAFWAEFESELRAKQLAAIVAKRPWWHGFSRVFQPIARHHVPVGAFAVLLLTVIGVRESGLFLAAQRAPSIPLPAPASVVARPVELSSGPVAQAETPRNLITAASSHLVAAPALTPSTVARAESRSAQVADGAQLISGGFAAFQPSAMDDNQRSFGNQDFTASFASTSAASSEPLARLNPVTEERRSRLLGTSLPTSNKNLDSAPNSERLVSRMSEDRLYESISRYGVGGDRFMIKF